MGEYEERQNYDARRTNDDDSRWGSNERSREENDSRDESWEAPFHVPRD